MLSRWLASISWTSKVGGTVQHRSRPLWRRVVNGVTGIVALLAWGTAIGNERRLIRDQPSGPAVQRGQQREVLLTEGWSPATPQRLIKPSYWPFVFGLGIAFLLGGIATDFMISGLGVFIFGFGMVGWIRDLLDEQDNG